MQEKDSDKEMIKLLVEIRDNQRTFLREYRNMAKEGLKAQKTGLEKQKQAVEQQIQSIRMQSRTARFYKVALTGTALIMIYLLYQFAQV